MRVLQRSRRAQNAEQQPWSSEDQRSREGEGNVHSCLRASTRAVGIVQGQRVLALVRKAAPSTSGAQLERVGLGTFALAHLHVEELRTRKGETRSVGRYIVTRAPPASQSEAGVGERARRRAHLLRRAQRLQPFLLRVRASEEKRRMVSLCVSGVRPQAVWALSRRGVMGPTGERREAGGRGERGGNRGAPGTAARRRASAASRPVLPSWARLCRSGVARAGGRSCHDDARLDGRHAQVAGWPFSLSDTEAMGRPTAHCRVTSNRETPFPPSTGPQQTPAAGHAGRGSRPAKTGRFGASWVRAARRQCRVQV